MSFINWRATFRTLTKTAMLIILILVCRLCLKTKARLLQPASSLDFSIKETRDCYSGWNLYLKSVSERVFVMIFLYLDYKNCNHIKYSIRYDKFRRILCTLQARTTVTGNPLLGKTFHRFIMWWFLYLSWLKGQCLWYW